MKKNIIIIIAIFLVAQIYAATRYVSIDGLQLAGFLTWENAATNIQVAIDAADPGDEIIVTNGIYIPEDSGGIYVNQDIKLKTVNGFADTIIDGGNTKRCLRIDVANAIVEGFTIRNGGGSGANGGGVFCVNGLIKNCLITDNAASGANGGGLFFNNNGSAENCVIKNNNSDSQGGGVYFNSGGTLRNCLIISNSASNGGGISFGGTGTVQNCTIVKNNATSQGGGAYALVGGRFINSIIYLNTSGTGSNIYNPFDLASLSFCYSAPVLTGRGNVSEPPLFLDETANWFQQNRGSSCINAGTNLSWMSGALDLDNNPRIFDLEVDIGIYEYLQPFIDIEMSNISNIAQEVFLSSSSQFALVSYDFESLDIEGTNNSAVVGDMELVSFTNSLTNIFVAVQNWCVSNVPIAVGVNEIKVRGTNRYGIITNDFTTIERGGIGTGLPFVSMTNEDKLVSYDFSEMSIIGTNNIHVMGIMWWTNSLTGQSYSFATSNSWEITNVFLEVGTNNITVFGTNYWNKLTNDTIEIIRGIVGTGKPFVDVTNSNTFVSYDFFTYDIFGTNNIQVRGGMWWTNSIGDVGTVLASTNWQITNIPLEVGINNITVFGTNYWGAETNDTIIIERNDIGTGIPFVNITNESNWLTFDFERVNISGTNNIQVMGGMWWTNSVTGQSYSFVATDIWEITNVFLEVGTNTITVFGTNYWNDLTNDTIELVRGIPGTGVPFIDVYNESITITNENLTFCFSNPARLTGTNNLNVVGEMWWTNSLPSGGIIPVPTNLYALGGTLPAATNSDWIITNIFVELGTNDFTIIGTNLFGNSVTDQIQIVYQKVTDFGNFFIELSNDYKQTILQWTNGVTADVLIQTNQFYKPSGEWETLVTNVASPFVHTNAAEISVCYYRIVNGSVTSKCDVGKYDQRIAGGDGDNPITTWITSPFVMSTNQIPLKKIFGNQLSNGDKVAQKIPRGGGNVYEAAYLMDKFWGSATNMTDGTGIIVTRSAANTNDSKVTFFGMVRTNKQAFVATVALGDGSNPVTTWIGQMYPDVDTFIQSGITNVLASGDKVAQKVLPAGGNVYEAAYLMNKFFGSETNYTAGSLHIITKAAGNTGGNTNFFQKRPW